MDVSGLQKLTLLDYPGRVACTVFTGGCNLRCPFCHNALLVTRLEQTPPMDQEEILSFLRGRRGLLDGVVLSGGEPLAQPGAVDFLRQVRELGFAVKLDTNGCYPERLGAILAEGLADYVAMDVKNRREKYAATVGVPGFDPGCVEESAAALRGAGVDWEMRTTLVRELHAAGDVAAIGAWMAGAPRYYLQNFVDSGCLIGEGFHGFSRSELEAFLAEAQAFFPTASLRGVD